jgi:hypothetical protein
MCLVMTSSFAPDLRAQGPVVASARISGARAWARGDSTKTFLTLEISGLPAVASGAVKLNKFQLVDRAGRVHVPTGVGYRAPRLKLETVGWQYANPFTPDDRGTPMYLYRVPRGETRFELRLPGMMPIAVNASIVGAPR